MGFPALAGAAAHAGKVPWVEAAPRGIPRITAVAPPLPDGMQAIDVLEGSRLLARRPRPDALDGLERLLARGQEAGPRTTLAGAGMNGPLPRVLLADGSGTVDAVIKPVFAQPAQERFAWGIARSVGVDHLAVPVAPRADGSVAMPFIDGHTFLDAQISSPAALETALRRGWEVRVPDMDPLEVAARARVDRELAGAFDYLLANPDRNGANGIVDAVRGQVVLIDHGNIGFGERAGGSVLAPRLKPWLHEASDGGRVVLDPATVEVLRAADRRGIRRAHRALRRAAADRRDTLGPALGMLQERRFLDGVLLRLDQLQQHGSYELAARTVARTSAP